MSIFTAPPTTVTSGSNPAGRPVYNFASGPGMMPRSVLKRAQRDLLDWAGSGMSVWELPFSGAEFQRIVDCARDHLRQLLGIPAHFRILFMQGGASAQFSLVPMNLLRGNSSVGGYRADYAETGHWSAKAIAEGRRYCRVNTVVSGRINNYTVIPCESNWQLDPDASYCHITSNETADGLQFSRLPDTGTVPLVVDMTSDFLSRPIDFDRVGLVYAGAQKNIGPAGLTLVIIREDLIRKPWSSTPSAFSYRVHNQTNGRFNTPLTYAIYLAGLVFEWLLDQGGVDEMQRRNREKSDLLYQFVDRQPLYHCPIAVPDRSRMNACFSLTDVELISQFLAQAQARGLINLQGHPARGGIRASLYNAMPLAGVQALIEFMRDFAANHRRAGERIVDLPH